MTNMALELTGRSHLVAFVIPPSSAAAAASRVGGEMRGVTLVSCLTFGANKTTLNHRKQEHTMSRQLLRDKTLVNSVIRKHVRR